MKRKQFGALGVGILFITIVLMVFYIFAEKPAPYEFKQQLNIIAYTEGHDELSI